MRRQKTGTVKLKTAKLIATLRGYAQGNPCRDDDRQRVARICGPTMRPATSTEAVPAGLHSSCRRDQGSSHTSRMSLLPAWCLAERKEGPRWGAPAHGPTSLRIATYQDGHRAGRQPLLRPLRLAFDRRADAACHLHRSPADHPSSRPRLTPADPKM